MHHPKLLRAKSLRSAMIPAALLCLILPGCADQEPTGPKIRAISRNTSPSFDKFFIAWSQIGSSGPIQTQRFALDARQERQWAWYADASVVTFARANPGRLYIVGDEPDQECMRPSDYAIIYHDFVAGVRSADPTARVSPSGFAEPNYKCCPLPNDVPAPCWSEKHSTGFADDFYNAYIARYGSPPPVNEWRFHDFGLRSQIGDMDTWWAGIDRKASWSVAHGANMVLGAWGLLGWNEPAQSYQEHLKQAMGRILNDPRINGAVYWALEQWAGEIHYLQNPDGSLTLEGQTYVNPLTDVPTAVTTVAATNGGARLQWTNTTSAWAAEVEFWVKAAGASSFVFSKTERVNVLGARETPLSTFRNGDTVQGRVRYYNMYGQADWSGFSEPVTVISSEQATTKEGSKKAPRVCFLPTGTQTQSCN